MKFLKSLVFLALIFEAVCAEDADKDRKKGRRNKVSYSVRSEWGKYAKKRCIPIGKWGTDLQSYYDGVEGAFAKYEGDAKYLGGVIMDSFRQYLSLIIQIININNGTVLSSSAELILKAISKSKNLRGPSTLAIIEFTKVFPGISNDLKNVALKLCDHIGHVAESYAKAVDEFSIETTNYLRRFMSDFQELGCQEKVNFKPTLEKLQKLMNLVALIVCTLLKAPDADVEVQHSVLLLSIIFWWFHMIGLGINASVLDMYFKNNCEVSPDIKSLSQSFNDALVSINKSLSVEVMSSAESINKFLAGFVKLNLDLNEATKDIFVGIDGVAKAVEGRTWNSFDNSKVASIST